METEKRERKIKEKNLCREKGDAKKVGIPKAIASGKKEGEAKRLDIRKVEYKDEKDKEERKEREKRRKKKKKKDEDFKSNRRTTL